MSKEEKNRIIRFHTCLMEFWGSGEFLEYLKFREPSKPFSMSGKSGRYGEGMRYEFGSAGAGASWRALGLKTAGAH